MNRNYLSEALIQLNKLEDAIKESTKRIHESKDECTSSINDYLKDVEHGYGYVTLDKAIEDLNNEYSCDVDDEDLIEYIKKNTSYKISNISDVKVIITATAPKYKEIAKDLALSLDNIDESVDTGTTKAKIGHFYDIKNRNDTTGYYQYENEDGTRFGPHAKSENELKTWLKSASMDDIRKTVETPKPVYSTDIKNSGITEDFSRISVETDDSTTEITNGKNGEISVTTTPNSQHSGETIEPIDDELKDDILSQSEDDDIDNLEDDTDTSDNEDEETIDDADEFVEESFNRLVSRYLNKIYENVNTFTTTNIKSRSNKYLVEGKINFKSGKSRNVKFIFESKGNELVGKNTKLSNNGPEFSIKGSVKDKKFITESLKYSNGNKNKGIIR